MREAGLTGALGGRAGWAPNGVIAPLFSLRAKLDLLPKIAGEITGEAGSALRFEEFERFPVLPA